MKIDLVRWEHCARVGLDLSYYTGGAMLGVKNCVSHLYLVPNTSSPPLPPLTTIAIGIGHLDITFYHLLLKRDEINILHLVLFMKVPLDWMAVVSCNNKILLLLTSNLITIQYYSGLNQSLHHSLAQIIAVSKCNCITVLV